MVPPEVMKRYNELKSREHAEPGKVKKSNAIINNFVSRKAEYKGTLVPKKATLERVMGRETRSVDAQEQLGYAELVCIGKVFSDSACRAMLIHTLFTHVFSGAGTEIPDCVREFQYLIL